MPKARAGRARPPVTRARVFATFAGFVFFQLMALALYTFSAVDTTLQCDRPADRCRLDEITPFWTSEGKRFRLSDLKEVVYEVAEGKTGKLSLGVSLSTDGGLGANASFQKRNFDVARPPTSWEDLTSGRAFTGVTWYSPAGHVMFRFAYDRLTRLPERAHAFVLTGRDA